MSLRRAFLSRKDSTSRHSTKPRKPLCSSLSVSSSSPFEELTKSHSEKENGEGDGEEEGIDRVCSDKWAKLLPELLCEIIQRVESSEDKWPIRRNVVSCACVCKRWREITRGIVKSPQQSGTITFPSSLKQPGPRDQPLQCFIERNKKTSTFYLYLGLTQPCTDKVKFLLAARRFRHGTRTEYIISLDADDLSQGSNAYVGKLSSDFLGTKFTIYDSQPLYDGAKLSSSRAHRRIASKQIYPQGVPQGSFEIGQVSYKFNLLRSKGPRRMHCTIQCPCSTKEEKEQTDTPKKDPIIANAVLKNKAPRWHENLQCWCLNFHGRVTVASVKNFQLIATVDPSQPGGIGDDDTVLLQFGKIGDDVFTMDYRQPLSAFQAFAICLTSFGTKLACE